MHDSTDIQYVRVENIGCKNDEYSENILNFAKKCEGISTNLH